MPWETTENEFRNRIRNPDDFREATFRTISLKGVTGVNLILAKLKPDKVAEGKNANSMVTQAIRFSKANWTLERAKAWFVERKEEFRGDQQMGWRETEFDVVNEVRSLSDFEEDTFKDKWVRKFDKMILVAFGQLKEELVPENNPLNKRTLQSVRFSKHDWSMQEAKDWFAENEQMMIDKLALKNDTDSKTKRVSRYDVTELEHTKTTPQGYLQTDGLLTKTGIFVYHKEDGSEFRELRLPEEVFDEESMKSFGNLAVTDGHPGETLDARNTYRFQIGHTFPEVKKEDDHLRTSLLITDERAIKKIEAGKQQLSNGYACDLEYSSGELSDGNHYDAIQRNIRGNHVAIVDRARGGSTVRLTLDSEDNADIPKRDSDSNTNKGQDSKSEPKEKTMAKVKFDGIETEIEAGAASIVSAAVDKRDSRIKELESEAAQKQTELDTIQAKLDSAAAKIKEVEKDKLDEDAVATLVNDRANEKVILLAAAKSLLAKEEVEKLDTMSDAEIRIAVIKADPVLKEISLDEKTDDYISALFEGAVQNAKDRKEKTDKQTEDVGKVRNSEKKDDGEADADKSRQDVMDKIMAKSRRVEGEGKEEN